MGPPFNMDSDLRTGVAALLAHQDKYCLLASIANDFASRSVDDEAELDTKGLRSSDTDAIVRRPVGNDGRRAVRNAWRLSEGPLFGFPRSKGLSGRVNAKTA